MRATHYDDTHPGRALGLIMLSSLCGMLLMAGIAMANEQRGAPAGDVEDPMASLTDPTRPNWYGLKAKGKANSIGSVPQLSSIIASNERRLAIINGVVMREGERKDGILLRQVLPDRVLVVTADKQLRALRLKRPDIGKEQR